MTQIPILKGDDKMKMNKIAKNLKLLTGLWLIFALILNSVPLVQPAQASDSSVSQVSSLGENEMWKNPWTLANYQGVMVNYTFFPTPQVFWNGTHWLDYVYEEHENYYLLRNSHGVVEVYDYYAKFYDVNYTEVRVYDERWEIQRWKPTPGKWDDVGAQSGTPVFTTVTNGSGIWLSKSFTSAKGVFDITYALRVASPLKHTVSWKSFITEETEFRIIQKWSGIVGDKVKSAQGEEEVTGPVTHNSTWFRFEKLDGNFTVFGNLWSTGFLDDNDVYRNYVLQPTALDVHAQGMKADFTFQNSTIYTIQKGGIIMLDPITDTFDSEASRDGYIQKFAVNSWPPNDKITIHTGFTSIRVGQTKIPVDSAYYYYQFRGYVSFDTSSIPSDALIESVGLRLKTLYDYSDTDFSMEIWGGSQPIYGSLGTEDWNAGGTYLASWSTSGWPGNNKWITLNVNTDQVNIAGRTQFRLRSNRDNTQPSGSEYVRFSSGDSLGNEPRLEVTYIHTLDRALTNPIKNPSFEDSDTNCPGGRNVHNLPPWETNSQNSHLFLSCDVEPVYGDSFGDGDVDRYDAGVFSYAYGSHIGEPKYNWRCDFDGDGDIDRYDAGHLASEYGKSAIRMDGNYSLYTKGVGDYKLWQWLDNDVIEALKGRDVTFSFWFYPETVAGDGSQNNARAEIYYEYAGGSNTVYGDWFAPTELKWHEVDVTASIPPTTTAIKVVIHGTTDFKACIDMATLSLTESQSHTDDSLNTMSMSVNLFQSLVVDGVPEPKRRTFIGVGVTVDAPALCYFVQSVEIRVRLNDGYRVIIYNVVQTNNADYVTDPDQTEEIENRGIVATRIAGSLITQGIVMMLSAGLPKLAGLGLEVMTTLGEAFTMNSYRSDADEPCADDLGEEAVARIDYWPMADNVIWASERCQLELASMTTGSQQIEITGIAKFICSFGGETKVLTANSLVAITP